MNEKKIIKQEKLIKKKTRIFHTGLSRKKEHHPSFPFLIWFSVFKAASKQNKIHLPADYNFYKDKNYFVDSKLNFIQKLSVYLFTLFFTFLIKKGFI